MDDLLKELEKTHADLAKQLRKAHADAIDEQKALITAAEKKAKTAEATAAKLKADADAGAKSVDEATAAARKERDEAKAAAEKAAADLGSYKLRKELERKLGISDESWSRRATDAFLTDYAEGVSLDDKGKLVGALQTATSLTSPFAWRSAAGATPGASSGRPPSPRTRSRERPSSGSPASSSATRPGAARHPRPSRPPRRAPAPRARGLLPLGRGRI